MIEKTNFLMPESEGPVLCYEISRPISAERYKTVFLSHVREVIKKYGEVRFLINYVAYQGWEEQAAILDLDAHIELGLRMTKLCLVNAPEKEIMSRIMRRPLTSAELRFFPAEKLADALAWVKEPEFKLNYR